MNEELHSTNEELETMNEELRDQTDHATRAHTFLGSILASVRQSVVVVDEDEDVTVWNDAAAELWGLRADEVTGRRFFDLDVGLPVTDLRTPVRAVLAGERPAPVELRARDRRGRLVLCTVSFSSLQGFGDQPAGVVLVTECVPLDE
jgi:two-component system CheB/CheR fusion protein